MPLPEWLPRAVGLQAGSLTLDSWPNNRKGFHSVAGCAALPEGRARLQSFDVVGVMDCMHSLLTSVCHALQWPCDEDESRLTLALKQSLKSKPHGVSLGGVMMREAYQWSRLDWLNETVVAGVRSAAECDRAMYTDAIRRMGRTPPSRHGERFNESWCEGATFVRPQAVARI